MYGECAATGLHPKSSILNLVAKGERIVRRIGSPNALHALAKVPVV
jgi:hypothetical protein